MKGVRVDHARILQLSRQGLSISVIATRMGISARVVATTIQREREARSAAELAERVHVRLQLDRAGADVSVELVSGDARVLAGRLVAAADAADRELSLTGLIESCR